MKDKTFAIIKPDAVKNGYTGKIYDRILKSDFSIIGAKLLQMTQDQAEGFYEVHKDRPFFSDLIGFMTSGPCMVLALEKKDAVQSWRDTIGSTNPKEAAENTIRKDFATNVQENAVHGSDSNENAQKEIAFFFTDSELLSN
tara:strand:- start:260 stop:682 length:423 start_codon:yes stop_codon:yes gene_type:complete